ncbi:MAG: PAS domain-containing protein [Chitinophagales bacterium]|nr:PAS domain-containing protein [Hyphomicrobiales bacterium]
MPEIKSKSKDQKTAESEVKSFRENLGPFVVAAETSRMPMIFTNAKKPDHPIIYANNSFLKLTQFEREEVLGVGFNTLLADGAKPEAIEKLKSTFDGAWEDSVEICYARKDGSVFWASAFVSPVRDESGVVVQHFTSFHDITKHKQEETQARMLINELNHRVKNTLSTVQAIVSQALRNPFDAEAVRESIESRIFALSRSHDLLTRQSWEDAGLREILGAALEPFGVANGRAERFVITGEDVYLPPKVTLALGIAFHELATNAVKYGAFSTDAGCVRISWHIKQEQNSRRLITEWREVNGPRVSPPVHKGFGSQVIERGLGYELEAITRLDYLPDGLVCTIDIPAPAGADRG